MKINRYSRSFLPLSLSLGLLACGIPAQTPDKLQPSPLLRAVPASAIQELMAETFVLLKAPSFYVQQYLDALQNTPKLVLINGVDNPVDLATALNLSKDEYFALSWKLSKKDEFAVSLHPTQANTLNIKPLKSGAKATLTIFAGHERKTVELESPESGQAAYLKAVRDLRTFTVINGQDNVIELTSLKDLLTDEYFSVSWKVSKQGEFNISLHPTQANTLTIKPLKPDAKANLTLFSGNERAELSLITVDPETVALGDNLTVVFPNTVNMQKDESREIRVNGIAPGQFVMMSFKNSNPQGFRVENPFDQPNVLRVTALKNNATTKLTVFIGTTTRTLNFSSVADAPATLPQITLAAPVQGETLPSQQDVKLVATLEKPLPIDCRVGFEDETGKPLNTNLIPTETSTTQVTHLWPLTAQPQNLERQSFQAIVTCPTQLPIKSELVHVILGSNPTRQALALKASPVAGQEYTQVQLEFKPLPEIRDYKVYADDRLLGVVTTQPTDTVASFKAEGLSPGTTYNFKIEAIQNSLVSSSGMVKASTYQSTASGGGNFVPSTPTVNSTPVVSAPTITSLSTSSGNPGNSITITGTGFNATPGNNTVKFGTTTATVTAAATTSLTVTVPTLTAGIYNVTVTVGGQTNTGTYNFSIPGVSTIAGEGTAGYSDGVASAARFNFPTGITRDSAGNLYVAEYNGNRIRKIDTAGNVTNYAGDGTAGFSDGVASAARFGLPTDIANDSSGNLYVADGTSNRIRKIDTAGNVTTVAGHSDGTAGYSDGVASAARFNNIAGITRDSTGNLYIVEQNTNRIRKIDTAGNVTTVAGHSDGVAGNGDGAASAARFNQPGGIARDSAGNLYVADYNGNRIRKIDTAGNVSTFAGQSNGLGIGSADGLGSAAEFAQPFGITIDSAGNLYVADSSNHHGIRKITPAGMVTTVAGNGSAGYSDGVASAAQFNNPFGITVDSTGTLYIADANNNRIRKITP